MPLECEFSLKLTGYRCEIIDRHWVNPLLRVKVIRGDHHRGFGNKDVTMILMRNLKILFPRGIGELCPNVTQLEIRNCGLKSLCREDLAHFWNLEKLWVDNNNLKSLPDDLFRDKPKLTFISFKQNQIESMSSKIFQPIIKNKFSWISFEKNTKIDALYHPTTQSLTFNHKSVKSVAQLMKIIDSQCSKLESAENLSQVDLATVASKLTVPEVPSDPSQIHNEDLSIIYHENFPRDFASLFFTGDFSDFTITVDDFNQFRVHKCILATHSEVFAEFFKRNPDEREMKIEDYSPEAMEKFLRFLYTRKIVEFIKTALEIYMLSSKFKVFNLRNSMEKFILDHIDNFDALKVFSLGHKVNSKSLKRGAFETIQKNLKKKLPETLIENYEKVKETVEQWNEIKPPVED